MSKLWKGEAAKIRRRVLGAVNTRMKKKVGESDLGRVMTGYLTMMAGHTEINLNHGTPADMQARLYAAALGVSLEDAQARIAAQLEAVGDTFKPGKGYITGA